MTDLRLLLLRLFRAFRHAMCSRRKCPFLPFKTFSHARTLSSVYVGTVFLSQPRQWLQKRYLGGFEKFNACSIFFPWKIMLSVWACENEMTRYRQECFSMDVHGCLTLY